VVKPHAARADEHLNAPCAGNIGHQRANRATAAGLLTLLLLFRTLLAVMRERWSLCRRGSA